MSHSKRGPTAPMPGICKACAGPKPAQAHLSPLCEKCLKMSDAEFLVVVVVGTAIKHFFRTAHRAPTRSEMMTTAHALMMQHVRTLETQMNESGVPIP